jgi:hypothetical protein
VVVGCCESSIVAVDIYVGSFHAHFLTPFFHASAGKLTKLKKLWLHECDFAGPVPKTLSALTKLETVTFYGNSKLQGRSVEMPSRVRVRCTLVVALTALIPNTIPPPPPSRFVSFLAQ